MEFVLKHLQLIDLLGIRDLHLVIAEYCMFSGSLTRKDIIEQSATGMWLDGGDPENPSLIFLDDSQTHIRRLDCETIRIATDTRLEIDFLPGLYVERPLFAIVGPEIWATNSLGFAGQIVRQNIQTGTVLTPIAVPECPECPLDAICYVPDTQTAWCLWRYPKRSPKYGSCSITIFDLSEMPIEPFGGDRHACADVRASSSIHLALIPIHIIYDDGSKTVWIANHEHVAQIDIHTQVCLDRHEIANFLPSNSIVHDWCIFPLNGMLWIFDDHFGAAFDKCSGASISLHAFCATKGTHLFSRQHAQCPNRERRARLRIRRPEIVVLKCTQRVIIHQSNENLGSDVWILE